ncbi:MAG TPA: protein kinase [Candidatus Acidoferrales bacterium]|jgi:Tol biopolymer transport system component|nr:protein kinase [Candidatus Acidoferrales bacterium]
MSLPTSIAHYRITAKLGEGGMGEVWRATDTKLGREVAIKVLPDRFAADPDRMARFRREAQVLASLNHPNIAAIYGVEERTIVMELVPGDTLAELVARGPVPVAEALPMARQIAEALEAAHEKGIVHRDLKPANVKVTPAGVIKVLDFGLAMAVSTAGSTAGGPAGAQADLNTSPTLTVRATQAGMIMGTAAYMSPEQARGMAVDKRSDIWSFGVVLYELLTARPMFAGDTISDTLAAVLRADIDLSALPPETPPSIRRLLRRCLERDRKRRLPDIGVARLEIDEALGGAVESPAPAAAPQAHVAFRWWNAALALVALAGFAVAVVHFRETPPQPALMRFQIPAPEKTSFGSTGMALSPDGRQLAFIASGVDGRAMLWVRPLDSVVARALPGTEGAGWLPFWSPDSRFIGFLVQGKVKRIEAAGGPPLTLCEVPDFVIGGSWSRDGVIIFGTPNGGLFRVSQAGGAATRLTSLDQAHGELGHLRPWFLPDGRHFLYLLRTGNPETSGIYLATLDGPGRKRLAVANQAGAYAPPAAGSQNGHLLFLREGTLMALPLDASRFEPAGEAFPLAEQVGSWLAMGFFSVSANGVLAYRNGGGGGASSQLVWFDRQGKSLGALGPPGVYGTGPALSPDGSRAAVDQVDSAGNRNVWVLDAARGVPAPFTFDAVQDFSPVWSPDGTRLVLGSMRGTAGADGIYQKDSRGAGKEELLLQSGMAVFPNDWSPDGRYLLYSAAGPKGRFELWVVPAAGGTPLDSKPVPYLQGPYNEQQGQFSPDGQWIAYSSDETGSYQVYVQSFPAGAGKFQVSTAGGVQPRWRREGKEIFYIGIDGRLTAVSVKTAPRFETGAPLALFDAQLAVVGRVGPYFNYDVAADGKRFLVNSNAIYSAASAPTPITVIVNWQAAAKR